MSDLHTAAVEYLAIRRALGFKLRGHDRLIEDFIAFLTDASASTITTAAAVSGRPGQPTCNRSATHSGYASFADSPATFALSTRRCRFHRPMCCPTAVGGAPHIWPSCLIRGWFDVIKVVSVVERSSRSGGL